MIHIALQCFYLHPYGSHVHGSRFSSRKCPHLVYTSPYQLLLMILYCPSSCLSIFWYTADISTMLWYSLLQYCHEQCPPIMVPLDPRLCMLLSVVLSVWFLYIHFFQICHGLIASILIHGLALLWLIYVHGLCWSPFGCVSEKSLLWFTYAFILAILSYQFTFLVEYIYVFQDWSNLKDLDFLVSLPQVLSIDSGTLRPIERKTCISSFNLNVESPIIFLYIRGFKWFIQPRENGSRLFFLSFI